MGRRVGPVGAQKRFAIRQDLTTRGKVIGGGMPVGAFGGKDAIMSKVAPLGPVYQAGTLSGNPVAMAAGLATLELISRPGFFDDLSAKTKRLAEGLKTRAQAFNVPLVENHVGGMFGLFFTDQDGMRNYADVARCDVERFRAFFHGMLRAGVYLAPSAFEAGFVSAAHDSATLKSTLIAAEQVFSEIGAGG